MSLYKNYDLDDISSLLVSHQTTLYLLDRQYIHYQTPSPQLSERQQFNSDNSSHKSPASLLSTTTYQRDLLVDFIATMPRTCVEAGTAVTLFRDAIRKVKDWNAKQPGQTLSSTDYHQLVFSVNAAQPPQEVIDALQTAIRLLKVQIRQYSQLPPSPRDRARLRQHQGNLGLLVDVQNTLPGKSQHGMPLPRSCQQLENVKWVKF